MTFSRRWDFDPSNKILKLSDLRDDDETIALIVTIAGEAGEGGGGGAVDSVNGEVGVVVLDAADIGAAEASHGHPISEITSLQATLDAKAGTTHTHIASEVTDSTVTGRAVLTAADAAAARAAIGAGTSSLALGTSGSTAKVGNYQPASTDISDSTSTGRAVLVAASQSTARSAIGAGTSSLALGTSGSTAKAGNYTPPIADLPAGSTLSVYWTGSAWPARPTARTDITVQWIGADEGDPPSGGVADVDIWIHTAV